VLTVEPTILAHFDDPGVPDVAVNLGDEDYALIVRRGERELRIAWDGTITAHTREAASSTGETGA
jgi:hypothetical protein